MGDFSLLGGGSDMLEAGFDYTSSLPTVITSNATAHTVGSYVELLSAANNDRPTTRILVQCVSNAASLQGDALLNIAIGGSGSEQIIIPNLFLPTTNTNETFHEFDFPVSIPSGIRLSACLQTNVGSRTFLVSLKLLRGGMSSSIPLGTVDDVGADTATTEAVTVNAAGTINTFGSWTEITPSTAESYKGFIVASHKVNGSMSDIRSTYDVGVGSAGNEEIIYSGQYVRSTSGEQVLGTPSPFVPVSIPAGTRIAVRVQADSIDADANMDFAIYGVR